MSIQKLKTVQSFIVNHIGKTLRNGDEGLSHYEAVLKKQGSKKTVVFKEFNIELIIDADYGDSIYVALLRKSKRVVGFLEVDLLYGAVMGSYIQKEFQGKGLGFALYGTALKDKKVLRSDSSLSKGSSILWGKLCTAFKGCVLLRKGNRRIPIVRFVTGPKYKGYTFPVVKNVRGEEVCLDSRNIPTGPAGRTAENVALRDYVYEIRL